MSCCFDESFSTEKWVLINKCWRLSLLFTLYHPLARWLFQHYAQNQVFFNRAFLKSQIFVNSESLFDSNTQRKKSLLIFIYWFLLLVYLELLWDVLSVCCSSDNIRSGPIRAELDRALTNRRPSLGSSCGQQRGDERTAHASQHRPWNPEVHQ